eukprot:14970884-Alexandrium_andersonii.AAC.1
MRRVAVVQHPFSKKEAAVTLGQGPAHADIVLLCHDGRYMLALPDRGADGRGRPPLRWTEHGVEDFAA